MEMFGSQSSKNRIIFLEHHKKIIKAFLEQINLNLGTAILGDGYAVSKGCHSNQKEPKKGVIKIVGIV